MVADNGEDRKGMHKFIARFCGIIIKDCPSCGINPVHGVLRGAAAGFGYGLVDLPVRHTGKSARLVNHAGDGVGKRGMLHPVENNRSDGHLPR